jgi:leucyl-tRNA synthetase
MSKSKKNTVDPEPIVDQYGADAVRWFMLSDSPPERDLEWSEAASRALALRPAAVAAGHRRPLARRRGEDKALDRKLHQTIAAVGEATSRRCSSTRRSPTLRAGQRDRESAAPSAPPRAEAIRTLLLLVAPMVPHLAEEAWAALGARA